MCMCFCQNGFKFNLVLVLLCLLFSLVALQVMVIHASAFTQRGRFESNEEDEPGERASSRTDEETNAK